MELIDLVSLQNCFSHSSSMASSEVPKTCRVLTAETISKSLLQEVRDTLSKIQESSSGKAKLVAFLANDDPAAVKYGEWSKKTCEEK